MESLTEPQVSQLTQELEKIERELSTLISATAEDAAPVDLNLPIGRLSRMDAMQQQQMSKATRGGYERRLAQVKQALMLVEEGEYGYCRQCAEPVGYKRLAVRPEAPFCIGCQEEVEGR